MANKNAEYSSQPPPVQPQQQQQQQQQPQQQPPANEQDQDPNGNADARSRAGNTVFKSGPLSISSKGLGWTTWKKRWFILTRTSLVFFRSDPSAVQQKGSEVNLTLGGIDLNNSGSVVVKADKKLLTVLFPDGRDGRAFTLKADTMEDLNEWKAALENALTQAPSASNVMGQNGIFRNDHSDNPTDVDEKKDETSSKSTVLGRPVLLALEDVDGSPSFLEKALRFVEDHGSKTEGVLRQAADVDDVEHRIREYEQGKNEFAPGEDAHVIGDCLKYFLRELPSSPVPASCCKALLDACRSDRGNRVNAMRAAICETFPEPNRRLLQRILMMMQVVASNKNVNRMNTNAVAACMAPLLLRPLLAGDCEIENDFDVGGDGSMQLLQAAAAANHAQAIVITLLEEYNTIFGEGSLSPGLYSDSEESGSGTEEGSDDEEYDDDDDDDDDDGSHGSEDYTDDEEYIENESNGSYSESAASDDYHGDEIDLDDPEINGNSSSESRSTEGNREPKVTKKFSSSSKRPSLKRSDDAKGDENILVKGRGADNKEVKSAVEVSKTEDKKSDSASGERKSNRVRTSGKKNLSIESIDFTAEVDDDDDDEIKRLESTKLKLQNRTAEEAKNNAVLQANLEQRKKALYERRQALKEDVERLQEELKKERDRKLALESGLKMSKGKKVIPETIDEKLKKDLQDVAQAEADIAKLEDKVDDLEHRLGKEGRKKPEHNAKESETEKQNDSRTKSSQQEMTRGGSSKGAGMSKKSGPKGEGNTTTTIAALSKLTMRLNFLKERRSQIANELSNMDKSILSPGISNPSSGENRGSESLQEVEKGSSSNQNQSQNQHQIQSQNKNQNQSQNKNKNQNQNQSQNKNKNQDKSQNQSQNKDKNQSQNKDKSQNQSQNKDKNQNQDSDRNQNPHVLDRGRSDNGGDKDRGRESGESSNPNNTTQRTFSR